MKKLTKIHLMEEMEILSKAELRQLMGSGDAQSGCNTTYYTQCYGDCDLEGNKGTCQWVQIAYLNLKACQCITNNGFS